ncbi:helix-turn-helix domain-containing protein [Streptomyces europaeiscabiei]|uniref:Helix-turn-helix domain-containing protein n=7 Tax=Streptomyces europaeiscabiei TaxID=146819 RepID=A0ABU4NLE4_9ACTN|nr:helix-turn-helix domain-containing protein [Streptomyces europaeiscabiei]MDX2528326.1 helix-turn-helix domain-containing protein [Streptomyces europaeiscabiei]MDX3546112.1 helix-turn-helix domain-containing protein [Streptomyces europaeiscabiei]MDX3557582.1 helix-turn-helix domain-containing protein [Streptomyces europaeiscabiei]MDX3668002.1 helix-turn-helix domain-containing protein [Streptomyces europaeiscabiei]MDX3703511.1 helix-turn-helix domain-containing protein [Streptomyces europaei
MGLRIHFTYEDLARVVLAEEPDPLWEGLLSLHLLQNRDGPLVFGRWRRATRGHFDPELPRLRRLAPPRGYSADFLTPAGAADGFEPGVDALLATPRTRLRTDLTELALARPLPGWARPLADGDTQALRGLSGLVRRHHERFVAPYWGHVRARFDEARSVAARALLRSGFGGLAEGLHPSVRWSAPVLHITGPHLRGDLHLDGRGLRIIPSFFCWPGPIVLRDGSLPPVLVHPVTHDPRWLAPPPPTTPGTHRALAALLGRARAAVLEEAAEGRTTSELAARVGLSPPTVSHHVAVLRESGLLTSRRIGGTVLHTVTGLGADLLGGGVTCGIRPRSKAVVRSGR